MARNNEVEVIEDTTEHSTEVAEITDKALLAQFAEMAVMIPADPGGGTEDILRQILSATTWDQLNDPWSASEVDDLKGLTLHVTSVIRRASSFKGGLGMMLVIKMTDAKTQKQYVKATGSVAIVGQFAWLYAVGATAVTIQWHKAERPTEKGFYPQHIEIIDAYVPPRDGGS